MDLYTKISKNCLKSTKSVNTIQTPFGEYFFEVRPNGANEEYIVWLKLGNSNCSRIGSFLADNEKVLNNSHIAAIFGV